MNKNGPIIVIEDDMEDQELMSEVFAELGYKNEILFFGDGELALDHLVNNDVEPFIVFSDINMPKLNGMELREKIHNNEDLRIKSIPYLFFSTVLNQSAFIKAYSVSAQGFFQKQNSIKELENTIILIMEYWKLCAAPNNF